MNILGISAFYHDSAAARVRDGEIIAAAQEERFTRKKHDNQFPVNAVEYCLQAGDLAAEQLDYVVFYEKPLLLFGIIGAVVGAAGIAGGLWLITLWQQGTLNPNRPFGTASAGSGHDT